MGIWCIWCWESGIWRKALWASIQAQRRALIWGLSVLGIFIVMGAWLVSIHSFPIWMGLQGRKAWDLAQLPIMPFVLVVVTYLFSQRQKQAELHRAIEPYNNVFCNNTFAN